jgi:4-hydroxy-2-oxoheptanedioate aldolase
VNPIKVKVEQGTPAIGSSLMISSDWSAEMFGKAGFDFLLLDAQHGEINYNNMLPILQHLSLGSTPALVRVPWNDTAQINRALDYGAAGVVVPMISTHEDAAKAAAATRYPPMGIRSFGALRNAGPTDQANENALCIVMIETALGMENLDAIVSTHGVDGVVIGPNDLTLGLGHKIIPGKFHDEVYEAVDKIVSTCNAHGKLAGMFSPHQSSTEEFLKRGAHYVIAGADLVYVLQGAAQELEFAKKCIEEIKQK